MSGLMTKIKAVRMMKLIVWHSMIFLDLLYIGTFVAACTIVLPANRADLIKGIMMYSATTHGGELMLTAALRLWGKEEPK